MALLRIRTFSYINKTLLLSYPWKLIAPLFNSQSIFKIISFLQNMYILSVGVCLNPGFNQSLCIELGYLNLVFWNLEYSFFLPVVFEEVRPVSCLRIFMFWICLIVSLFWDLVYLCIIWEVNLEADLVYDRNENQKHRLHLVKCQYLTCLQVGSLKNIWIPPI